MTRASEPTALAIDVGGTKLACGLVGARGDVTRSRRIPTPVTADPEVLWSALAELVDDVVGEGGSRFDAGVGVACGGPMRLSDGLVSPLNIPGWRDFPLLARVGTRWGGDLPVRLHNDAVAAALAESRWGAGREAAGLLGMVVSTGVGGGLLLDGRVVAGPTGNAGHVGHIVAEPDGPVCGCGGRGCLEAVARGPALAADAVSRGWRGEQTALAVAQGARAGDPACVAAYARAGRAIGTVLAGVAALLDLDVVSIGGGVADAGDLLFGPVHEAYARHSGLAYTRRLRILPATFGSDASLVGAAALVLATDDR